MIHHGDCLSVLASLEADSIDACVTDPPYGLGFMGKKWDSPGKSFMERKTERSTTFDHVGGNHNPTSSADAARTARSENAKAQLWHQEWARGVYRVLKPGAFLVAFGGTRTYHRLTCAIEDAGFEIRDCLSWLYGSGFPKSLNLPDGRGTALKPGWEPCVLARKPTCGTVAANVERFGTGALNIDACRIAHNDPQKFTTRTVGKFAGTAYAKDEYSVTMDGGVRASADPLGRWPANVLLDEEAAVLLDEQSGELVSGKPCGIRGADSYGFTTHEGSSLTGFGDSGGASRFYYVAKPGREERDYGTDSLIARQRDDSRKDGNPGGDNPRNRGVQKRGNFHPTVKPIELMRWLVRLVTPPGGIVLDPFMGSGTTGMACRYELRPFVGIEREAEYVALAEARIAAVTPLFAEETA